MKKLLALAFILLGSLCVTSQEVKEYDQYKKIVYIDELGKFDFIQGIYEKEVVSGTMIKFMKLSHPSLKDVEFIRFNIDIGVGYTTLDYLILETNSTIFNNHPYTTIKLLSPFGDSVLFWYNDEKIYLFYNLDRCTVKDEFTYKEYYSGYIL